MWPVFPPSQVGPIVLAMSASVAFGIFVIQPAWGRVRAVRALAVALVAWFVLGFVTWAVGPSERGAGIVYSGILVLAPAAFVAPIAAALNRMAIRVAGVKPAASTRITRRALLHTATAALPAIAAAPGAIGLATAKGAPTMPVVRLRFPDLHPDLEGLKILHLSDLHLGSYFHLDDLERALAIAKESTGPISSSSPATSPTIPRSSRPRSVS